MGVTLKTVLIIVALIVMIPMCGSYQSYNHTKGYEEGMYRCERKFDEEKISYNRLYAAIETENQALKSQVLELERAFSDLKNACGL